ncbi:MAG: hypothetical protein DDT19_02943 [Syntrophomonadaceae bacterium]|nr:hypothetical protein [Bacillota bacterium]
MDKHICYFNLVDALKMEGCPICRLSQRSLERFFDNLLYENVNDPWIRRRIRKSLGFCKQHSTELIKAAKRAGDNLGIAIIYEDMLSAARADLEKIDPLQARNSLFRLVSRKKPVSKAVLSELLLLGRNCLACEHQRLTEDSYIFTLNQFLTDTMFMGLFVESDGLCLLHLREALAAGDSMKAAHYLLETEKEKVEHLLGELRELIRKHDYRFSLEPLGRERDSWLRAVRKTTGGIPKSDK